MRFYVEGVTDEGHSAFETYFAKDYIASEFFSKNEQEERCNRYLLQKATPELLVEIGIEAESVS